MGKRFVCIWFRYLRTDRFSRLQPHLANIPFVLVSNDHGRKIVSAANRKARNVGITIGHVLADARAILPGLEALDDKPEMSPPLLNAFAQWCIRFTPSVAIDLPDGLILDATGCAHLWGSEQKYIKEIVKRLNGFGYTVRIGMADTVGAAWAVAHFAERSQIVEPGAQKEALFSLNPLALRIEIDIAEKLRKLGLEKISDIIDKPAKSLTRRFGKSLIEQLNKALGKQEEFIIPIEQDVPYTERLPCLEPIQTRAGIEIALKNLLETLCKRLQRENKGLRQAAFICCRIDGKTEKIEIGTNQPSHNPVHLFNLFELKIEQVEPGLGIEVFIIEAKKVDEVFPSQIRLWQQGGGLSDTRVSELVDRISNRLGKGHILRYLPAEHHWPERSITRAVSLSEKPTTNWDADFMWPIRLLHYPELIIVAAPIPDYPPILFRYKGKVHNIKKADGPLRIEQEWWINEGEHRDYYIVEDEAGQRYWLFRSGHYSPSIKHQWFLHGYFA